jgi:hypothetical protein
LKYKLVCCFKLAVDLVIREFVYDMDGSLFLERELVGFGMDWYW